MPTAVPGPSTHQPIAHGGLSKTPVPPADQQLFSPQPIGRLEALMSKENRTLTLIKVGREEASTRFDALASQDEASYDDDVSDAEEDDIEVIPDEVDDTQVESLKPVGAISATDKEVRKATNKSGGGQTSKSVDKNPTQHSNKALGHDTSGTCKDKYLKDHISVYCVQQAGRPLTSCFNMVPAMQKMSNIFFHGDVTLTDGSTLQGGEWPGVPWYPDMPETRAAL